MNIGNLKINKINQKEVIYENNITSFTITTGKLFIEISGSFQKELNLTRGQAYSLSIKNVEGQEDLILSTIFEDYTFVAGSSDYVDIEGIYHSGVVTLNNRLQFLVI